ncbi:MAG TPA: thioredoxin family protein [Fimbriimonadaceae bacterium]|nr:thioredoxin family protein [Fimbriimonadaceae bacterium]
MKKIEVFTGSCRLCEGAVALVDKVADKSRFDVDVLSIDGDRAKSLGLTAVPSIVLDGSLLFAGLPTEEDLTHALA